MQGEIAQIKEFVQTLHKQSVLYYAQFITTTWTTCNRFKILL